MESELSGIFRVKLVTKNIVRGSPGTRFMHMRVNSCDVMGEVFPLTAIAQKMKFFIKDFHSKYDQIRNFLRIWSHLLKKSLMENFIFSVVCY